MAQAAGILNYNKESVRRTIVTAFKKHKGEAAPADIVAFTGLPKPQIDAELPAVADEYSGRLKVTESGEMLYSFPDGFKSRYRGLGPSLRRAGGMFLRGLAKAGTFVFKIWIMVMLVGYFVLFIALALMALLASMAGNSKNNKSRGGGGGALAVRLVDLFVRIWFYNEVFKSPGQRYREANMRAMKREGKRPLHKAIFSFVFGEPDTNAEHEALQKQVFAAMARRKKGMVLLEDFMALTGLPPLEADVAINRYLYEFEGTPEVSDNGTVYYHFPKLLMRARNDTVGADASPLKKLQPFSANSKSSNMWYAVINGINIAFGSYFLYFATHTNMIIIGDKIKPGAELFFYTFTLFREFTSNPVNAIYIGLGLVPLVFSALFWLVPLVRSRLVKKQNSVIQEENMRRLIYANALASPACVAAPDQSAVPEAARPSNYGSANRVLTELAAYEQGDPAGQNAWRLNELERKLRDVEKLREKVKSTDYSLGAVAFDSDARIK